MADETRPPRDFITITCKHPGSTIIDRHRSFPHDLDGARAWVGQPQHEVTFAGTAEEANAAALAFYCDHLRDVDGLRNPPPPRFADVHHFAVVDGGPCFAITYVIAGEEPPAEHYPTASYGKRAVFIGETQEQADSMRAAFAGQYEAQQPAEHERIGTASDPARAPPIKSVMLRVKDAKLFIDGKEIATLPEVKFTPRPPAGPRLYDTTGKGTVSCTATWSSADPADRMVQLERPQPKRTLRRLGWREKRRAAGAKRRGRR